MRRTERTVIVPGSLSVNWLLPLVWPVSRWLGSLLTISLLDPAPPTSTGFAGSESLAVIVHLRKKTTSPILNGCYNSDRSVILTD